MDVLLGESVNVVDDGLLCGFLCECFSWCRDVEEVWAVADVVSRGFIVGEVLSDGRGEGSLQRRGV